MSLQTQSPEFFLGQFAKLQHPIAGTPLYTIWDPEKNLAPVVGVSKGIVPEGPLQGREAVRLLFRCSDFVPGTLCPDFGWTLNQLKELKPTTDLDQFTIVDDLDFEEKVFYMDSTQIKLQ